MDQQQQISKGCLNCPRCNSTNTKFCYYNNYSLSQPRHFCKACKRYWTRGGTLRNVPVGGGCRKNSKRVKNRIVLPTPPSSSPILVDAPLSSSNQVSQNPTSTVPATIQGASNNVLSPLLFGSYKDTMVHQQQQPRNIYSEMNKPNTIADPTHALSFSCISNPIDEAYHSLQNVAPPSSTTRNQANELIKRLFPFQTMQQQLPSSIANGHHHIIGDQQQQEQRWSPNHDPDQVSSTYTTLPWPHNHQANMDG